MMRGKVGLTWNMSIGSHSLICGMGLLSTVIRDVMITIGRGHHPVGKTTCTLVVNTWRIQYAHVVLAGGLNTTSDAYNSWPEQVWVTHHLSRLLSWCLCWLNARSPCSSRFLLVLHVDALGLLLNWLLGLLALHQHGIYYIRVVDCLVTGTLHQKRVGVVKKLILLLGCGGIYPCRESFLTRLIVVVGL
jgi:hypothetical protein